MAFFSTRVSGRELDRPWRLAFYSEIWVTIFSTTLGYSLQAKSGQEITLRRERCESQR